MTHKSTFKVSAQQRSFYKRLTPLGWALVSVGVLVVGLVSVLLVMVMRRDGGGASAWLADPAATSLPTVGPTAIIDPTDTPSPTVWYAGLVTPTVTPAPFLESTPAFPAWWADQMTQDAEGRWWPPDDVIEMVREHYFATFDAYLSFISDDGPPDLDGIEAEVPNWYSGPQMEQQLLVVAAQRRGDRPVAIFTWDGTCILEAQEWSVDGLECTLGIACQDGTGTLIDAHTGEVVETMHIDHGGLVLMRMRYDPQDGHWKQHLLLDFIEVSGG